MMHALATQLFPDNDPRLKGANSEIFMEEAYKRMVERGYAIGNCDVTLILQKPKVFAPSFLFLAHSVVSCRHLVSHLENVRVLSKGER